VFHEAVLYCRSNLEGRSSAAPAVDAGGRGAGGSESSDFVEDGAAEDLAAAAVLPAAEEDDPRCCEEARSLSDPELGGLLSLAATLSPKPIAANVLNPAGRRLEL